VAGYRCGPFSMLASLCARLYDPWENRETEMSLTPQTGIMNIALYEGGKSSIEGIPMF